MECVFGLVGIDFAVVAADSSAVHNILVHKSNEDKIMILDSHKLIVASGEPDDRCSVHLLVFKVLDSFKSIYENPCSMNILLAGYEKEISPSLYYMDYIATLHKVDKGAFGYGSYFSLVMMDRHYHSGMTVEEAIDLVDKCIIEIRSRLVVDPPNFVIKIIDKDGVREYAWRESVKDAVIASA
ncbi:Proteasome subunit beta type-2-A [Hibiscus syriacus]|uniref:Proteasome subunit beta type-2-A n=1 Tax=Hibiscus syriacus TaxID=106335 RepID=A0A6A3CK26_HIBSY|nr:Proteasome subunit beta type-2-A [Hibiscus syriacus]